MCKNPFVKGIQPYGCGQCLPCRLNRRRLWAHRLMLEARCHEHSSFNTLTYSNENLPPSASLNPKHTQDWLKRLRQAHGPVRYYLCGEYGEETNRPHYHPVLFGFPPCPTPNLQATSRGCSCYSCSILRETWTAGKSHSGSLTLQSAQYVAGYVTKKMTIKEDPRLNGRHPEFARMSLRPGIGALAVPSISGALNSSAGARHIASEGDVPTTLRHENKLLPLGRYLRTKLREEMGFDHVGGQEKPQKIRHEEMSALLEASGSRARYLTERPFIESQKILQVELKSKIWKKKSSI